MFEGTDRSSGTESKIREVDLQPGDDALGRGLPATLRMETYLATVNMCYDLSLRFSMSNSKSLTASGTEPLKIVISSKSFESLFATCIAL